MRKKKKVGKITKEITKEIIEQVFHSQYYVSPDNIRYKLYTTADDGVFFEKEDAETHVKNLINQTIIEWDSPFDESFNID